MRLNLTSLYERSRMGRSLLNAGQFAHIPEAAIWKALRDIGKQEVQPFKYDAHRVGYRDRPEGAYDWPWEGFHALKIKPIWGGKGKRIRLFAAAGVFRVLEHRHGALCHICCNSDAKYIAPRFVFFPTHCTIGNDISSSDQSPNICQSCFSFCKRFSVWTDQEIIIAEFLKMAKRGGWFRERLQEASKHKLRFNPRYWVKDAA